LSFFGNHSRLLRHGRPGSVRMRPVYQRHALDGVWRRASFPGQRARQMQSDRPGSDPGLRRRPQVADHSRNGLAEREDRFRVGEAASYLCRNRMHRRVVAMPVPATTQTAARNSPVQQFDWTRHRRAGWSSGSTPVLTLPEAEALAVRGRYPLRDAPVPRAGVTTLFYPVHFIKPEHNTTREVRQSTITHTYARYDCPIRPGLRFSPVISGRIRSFPSVDIAHSAQRLGRLSLTCLGIGKSERAVPSSIDQRSPWERLALVCGRTC
jgi:hypothetical protein